MTNFVAYLKGGEIGEAIQTRKKSSKTRTNNRNINGYKNRNEDVKVWMLAGGLEHRTGPHAPVSKRLKRTKRLHLPTFFKTSYVYEQMLNPY